MSHTVLYFAGASGARTTVVLEATRFYLHILYIRYNCLQPNSDTRGRRGSSFKISVLGVRLTVRQSY